MPLPILSATVLRPGDDGYDAHRRGYNLAVDQHPAMIVVANGAGDVVAAVRHATAHGLRVAVQATGHGPTVPADGALLIDTRRMDEVVVDPVARIARFSAGVRSGALVAAAAEHGLAPLSGSAPGVGAVSYHLGGGVGLLSRELGYAVDHVRALEIVTADGRLRRVSAERDADLFWALRGAGKGRFGVVVAMEIGLHAVPRLYGGSLHLDAARTPEALHTWARWTSTTPEPMGSSVMMVRLPDRPAVPEHLRGRHVCHLRFAFTGPRAEGERWVAPFRALGPFADTVREMSPRDVGTIHAEPTAPVAFHSRNTMLDRFDADAVDTLLAHAGPGAGAPYLAELRHLGGATDRPARVGSALARGTGRFCLYTGGPAGPAGAGPLRADLDRVHRAMEPWGSGRACVNFLAGPDVTAAQAGSGYRAADRARIEAVRREADPAGVFGLVPPLGG